MKNQQLKAFMEANRIQQKQMAQMLGVSVAVVSLYLRGEYKGDVNEIDRKVDEMFERQKAKVVEAKYKAEFVPTLAAKRGMEVMQFAHVEGEINVIFGAAGLGKTQMLKEYARKNSSAVLIVHLQSVNGITIAHNVMSHRQLNPSDNAKATALNATF